MVKIYNTLTGKLEEFKPLVPGEVSMYVCGPTVYNYIHIGNARPAMFFDTVRRYLEYRGYNVKYVQNFTDVDDKMIKRANEEGITLKDVADKYISAYFEDTAKVNLKEEGMIRPKATDYIGEMISLIETLISRGYAYESNGDVYFNIEKYKNDYGQLSKQNVEELNSGVRIDVSEIKNSPLDFALWKSAKKGEPSWTSPWGEGRPGWHIECSAMSNALLGPTFDIHGGGQDLIFPHHENEIAQSKCGTGGDFARYWIHNGYINVKGEKMSKSLGNFFLLREVLDKFPGNVVRFFVLSSHYRKPIDFSEDELKQAESGLERIRNAVERGEEQLTKNPIEPEDWEDVSFENLKEAFKQAQDKFIAGMDEDFNTAIGIGAIFELTRELNRTFDLRSIINKEGQKIIEESLGFIRVALEDVLGVKIKEEGSIGYTSEMVEGVRALYSKITDSSKDVSEENLPQVVEEILQKRRDARAEKNWGLSDEIRDGLQDIGIKIKDGKETTQWSI